MSIIIALDAMGGDHGPSVIVPAAARILVTFPQVELILVGQMDVLAEVYQKHIPTHLQNRCRIHAAIETVAMDESPAVALRTKKDSSMRVAINLVKNKEAHACVSAGNTGALMATARFVLKTLPGIDRPAIVTKFPTQSGQGVHVLDLGANVDSSPENLFQFAVMGSVLSQAENVPRPRIGLLNIGSEDIKGNELVKKTAELLTANPALNYIGYVEGDSIFKDVADVVVCDGFVGNVALKAVEGLAKLMGRLMKEAIMEKWWTKLLTLPAVPVLKRAIRKIDPERHNGAALIGLDGIVIKSHGGASSNVFFYAIEEAIIQVQQNVPQLIRQRVTDLLNATGTTPT